MILHVAAATCLLALAAPAKPVLTAEFRKGGWEAKQFIMVKSPRWPHRGTWVQEADHIRNAVPKDATPKQLLSKRAGETYTSMVWRKPVKGAFTARVTTSFDHRMAPLIVLAPELGKGADGGAEYRGHVEIVLYDRGVNVWRHFHKDGRPSWKKLAWMRLDLKPKVKHVLSVRRRGPYLTVRADEREFGVRVDDLPESLYVGITGCEGVNRFYDFTIKR